MRQCPSLSGAQRCMRNQVGRAIFHCRAGRMIGQAVAVFPVAPRTDRAWREAAPAVGADIAQNPLGAICAEGAFIRADARVLCIRWQRRVAVFAGGAQFQHHGLGSNGKKPQHNAATKPQARPRADNGRTDSASLADHGAKKPRTVTSGVCDGFYSALRTGGLAVSASSAATMSGAASIGS